MFGGVICALGLFWFHRFGALSFPQLVVLERVFITMLSGGHMFAPFFLLLVSSNERTRAKLADPKLYPRLFIILAVPFLLLSLSAWLFSSYGRQATPLSLYDLRWPIAVMGFMWFTWNQWHFGMQHFGVLQIYRSKAGCASNRSRRFDFWLTILIAGVAPFLFHLQTNYGIMFINSLFGPTKIINPYIDYIAIGIFLTGVITILASLFDARITTPIRLAYASLFAQLMLIWYFPLAFIVISYYVTHWLQEIFLVSRIYAKEKAEDTTSSAFKLTMAGIVIALIVFSATYIHFFQYPYGFHRIFVSGGVRNLDSLTPDILWSIMPVYALVVFFGTAHFYLDRLIHKGRRW